MLCDRIKEQADYLLLLTDVMNQTRLKKKKNTLSFFSLTSDSLPKAMGILSA